MKSVCVTKAKAYYIIADGYTECYTFNSREEAESFIELFKPFYKNKTVMIQEANVFTSYIMNDYNFRNCTGNNLGYYTGTIGLHGDIYVPGHVPTINKEVKLYKTFARAKQGAQAIYNKCGYVQKFEIHTIEIRANDKKEIVTVRGLP